MKRLLEVNRNSNAIDIAILVARVGIGALMLSHGLPKMMMLFSGEPVKFPSVLGMTPDVSLLLAVLSEVACSVLLIAGLATRIATIPLIITMMVAVFGVHAADPFTMKEPGLKYLLVYIVLLFTGSGRYSLDYLLQQKGRLRTVEVKEGEDPTLSMY